MSSKNIAAGVATVAEDSGDTISQTVECSLNTDKTQIRVSKACVQRLHKFLTNEQITPMSELLKTSFECVQNANERLNKLLTGDVSMDILFRTDLKQ